VVGAASGGGRFRAARLTDRGQEGQWAYTDAVSQLDTRLAQRLGVSTVSGLRAALEPLAGDPDEGAQAPLMAGLEPQPGNWRADVRPPRTLPHFPMVLHRGGFPDGS
jgi:hypothetical protein